MTIHHGADETKFMLTKVEHAECGILCKHRHYNQIAAFLYGLHKRAHTRLDTCHLKTNLIALIAECLAGCVPHRCLQHIGCIFNATLTCLGKTQIAHIGNQHPLGSTCLAELGNEIANGSGTTHNNVLALDISTVGGMGSNS